MDHLMSPEGVVFEPVSKSLALVRILGASVPIFCVMVAVAVLGFTVDHAVWYLLIPLVLVLAWLLWLIPRQVSALQYATGETDFFIRKGIMFKRLDQVPYGRIQYVEAREGPVARHFKIATLHVYTASAQTEATLPGVTSDDAARIRALLVARGAKSGAGI